MTSAVPTFVPSEWLRRMKVPLVKVAKSTTLYPHRLAHEQFGSIVVPSDTPKCGPVASTHSDLIAKTTLPSGVPPLAKAVFV